MNRRNPAWTRSLGRKDAGREGVNEIASNGLQKLHGGHRRARTLSARNGSFRTDRPTGGEHLSENRFRSVLFKSAAELEVFAGNRRLTGDSTPLPGHAFPAAPSGPAGNLVSFGRFGRDGPDAFSAGFHALGMPLRKMWKKRSSRDPQVNIQSTSRPRSSNARGD